MAFDILSYFCPRLVKHFTLEKGKPQKNHLVFHFMPHYEPQPINVSRIWQLLRNVMDVMSGNVLPLLGPGWEYMHLFAHFSFNRPLSIKATMC